MIIRHTTKDDVPEVLDVFRQAREIMRASGNLHQWNDSYPGEEVVLADMEAGNSYVVVEENSLENEPSRVVGTFAFIPGIEPSYLSIYDGSWIDDTLPYATIHRLASTHSSHGVAAACFDWAWEHSKNLRIDTHRDNLIMQHCIEKAGFRYCGIIYLLSGDERLAYQRI